MNIIEKLEDLKGMTAEDKGSILLVHGDLKPAAFVVMEGEVFHLPGDVSHINPTQISILDEILTDLGLKYITTTEVMENASNKSYEHGQEVMLIFVSKDLHSAEQLKAAFDDIQNNHHEAGILLGYPITAVDAFLTPDMLDWSHHPKSTAAVSALNMRLLGHRLSKDNWQEEVKYLEASGKYLEATSPTIYTKITAEED